MPIFSKKLKRKFKTLKAGVKKKGIKGTDVLYGGAAIRIAEKTIEQRHIDSTVEGIEEIRNSMIAPEAIGTSDSDGHEGDIKVSKIAKNKYAFLIKGEDGWHRDTNASFSHINSLPDPDGQLQIMMQNGGLIDNQFRGISRVVWDLDSSSLSTTTATPKLDIKGNFDLISKGNMEIKSGSAASPKNIKIDPYGSTEIASTLKVSSIASMSSTPSRFVVTNTSGDIQYTDKEGILTALGVNASDTLWVEYPFIVTNGVTARPYYRDVDDLYGDFRKWDDYDASPTSISRGDVAGHYVVPENCTLKHMRAVVTNTTSGGDIIIAIYHGTPTLDSSGATTLALAGSEETVTINTSSYNYAKAVDYDVDLDAGDIIVPMVEHNEVANQTFRGNLTLKFITR